MTTRVLALHGFHGTAQQMRHDVAPLFAGLDVEIVAIDAPPRTDDVVGWWRALETADGKHYEGWQTAREAIIAAFAKHGPFDVVFGFSQGAVLTGLLVGLPEVTFELAIIVGGFTSNDPTHARIYDGAGYQRRSLHIIGTADSIVLPAASRALAARFKDPVILEHEGDHMIPTTPAARAGLAAFLGP